MSKPAPAPDTLDALSSELDYVKGRLRAVTGETKPLVARLTKQQSQIIHALESAKGRTVEFAGLWDALYWDRSDGGPIDDRRVKRLIGEIRKRRPDLAARIRTHRGVGYSMVRGTFNGVPRCDCGKVLRGTAKQCASCAKKREWERGAHSHQDPTKQEHQRSRIVPCAGCGRPILPPKRLCGECEWALRRSERQEARP